MASDGPRFRLHTFYRSSCSGRLRIALQLKNVDVEFIHVALHEGQQFSAEHKALNPSSAVPVLTDLVNGVSIAQSVAALEYLEEILPDHNPLLPPRTSPAARAQVRALVNIIACDIQPVTNRRILHAVEGLGRDPQEWTAEHHRRGLASYESTAKQSAGRFSVGDQVSLADVCLVPACWTAEHCGVDLDAFPTVHRVFNAMSAVDAVIKAHWSAQKDTPSDLSWL